MFLLIKLASLSLVLSIMIACSAVDKQESPKETEPLTPPATVPENTLYTDMTTYGQDMGCGAALRNGGLSEAGWEQAPSLPGTYDEYLSGWREGFNKCRIGLGPVVPPDGVYP